MHLRLIALSSLLAGSSCLDAPRPDAPILVECKGVSGVVIRAEFEVPCVQLEAQVTKARDEVVSMGIVPEEQRLSVLGGLVITYRDADLLACRDELCTTRDIGYWHGENWPQPSIEVTRTGGIMLHELLHQADAKAINSGAIGEDHQGWKENGREAADYRFRSEEAL